VGAAEEEAVPYLTSSSVAVVAAEAEAEAEAVGVAGIIMWSVNLFE
jgi:hypothetical protein